MRDNSMMVRADAKSIGMVTSNSVRVNERWKGSGTKSGECVSIFPDGTRIPFTRTRNTPDSPARKRTQNLQNVQRDRLLKIAGTIRMGDQD